MFTITPLTKSKLAMLNSLNSKRHVFNALNEDFFLQYSKSNFIEKYLLRKQVFLLKFDDNYIGYIWYNLEDEEVCIIRAMCIIDHGDLLPAYCKLVDRMKGTNGINTIVYSGENNSINTEILAALGFMSNEGTIDMYLDTENMNGISFPEDISFEVLKRGMQEELRCKMQNEIFDNADRIPLSLEDIIFDENQDYYVNKGAIFIKEKEQYAGYGQIVIDNDKAYIVNFGILKNFRQKGYGKCLIHYLVYLVKQLGHCKVYIKVDSNNNSAIGLYRCCGFITEKEQTKWELKVSR